MFTNFKKCIRSTVYYCVFHICSTSSTYL